MVMEVDRTYRTVTFQSSCGTHVAISISAEWMWSYLKNYHYVLSLPILKQSVIPKIIEFCYHYLDEPMTEIPCVRNNSNDNVCCGMMIHSLVQPWYASFLCHRCGSPEIRVELLIASRILNIQPLEDLIATTLPFPHKKYSLSELRAIFVESCNSNSQQQKRKMEGQCNGSRKR